MDTTMMSSSTLEIDGMSGDACVTKVTNSLRDVKGVSNAAVTVGAATMKADQAGCEAACSAIGKAGFKAHEAKPGADAHGKGNRPANQTATDASTKLEEEAWSNEGGKGKDKPGANRVPAPGATDQLSAAKPTMPIPSPAVANAPASKPGAGNDANQRPTATTAGKAPAAH